MPNIRKHRLVDYFIGLHMSSEKQMKSVVLLVYYCVVLFTSGSLFDNRRARNMSN